MVVFVQICLYFSLLLVTFILFQTEKRTRSSVLLVLSPAFTLFTLLNPQGGFRKELIALNAFGVLLIGIKRQRFSLLILALLGVLLGVLLHETTGVLLPVVLLLLNQESWVKRNREKFSICLFLLGSSFVFLVWSFLSKTTNQDIEVICSSWNANGLNNCQEAGPIYSLAQSWSYASSVLRKDLFPGYWAYLLPLILALLPIANHWNLVLKNRMILIVVVFSFLPLFTAMWDYGRLIFFMIGVLSLFILFNDKESEKLFEPNWFVVALFSICWGFAAYGDQSGALGLLPRLLISFNNFV
jgi:hypothetical protein